MGELIRGLLVCGFGDPEGCPTHPDVSVACEPSFRRPKIAKDLHSWIANISSDLKL
jgi:hypothetical protein